MSEVIRFLEAMGRRPAPFIAEYSAAVAGLAVDELQRDALLNRDHGRLNELLSGRSTVRCIIATPEVQNSSTHVPTFVPVIFVPDELN